MDTENLCGTEKEFMEMLHNLSRADWDKIDVENWQKLSDHASAIAVIASEISEYAGFRGGYGCGDSGHDKAIEKAQKARKRIRKALGYSYP